MDNNLPDNLGDLRVLIDKTDNEIYKLIKKRAELAHQVGEVKNKAGDNAFYKPEREAQVLRNVAIKNDSLLRDKDMAYIFRQIMSACLALESPMNIAYLGPEGTWTGEAAIRHFGSGVKTSACFSIDEVFASVEKNNANYGVVPIENSTGGTITATVNLLYKHNLKICGETEVRVKHQLLSNGSRITKIVAHQQALDQCRVYLKNHYPNVEQQAVASNGLAAKMASENNDIAAIASSTAGEIYTLQVIAKNIEDNENNTTRFLIIGREDIGISGDDKTTILITAKHKSGMLFDILTPFKESGVNLLKLDSYPDPNHHKWQYLFLVDFAGHILDGSSKKIMQQLGQLPVEIKVVGSYPTSVL
jgi:chorismate mutase/prephenate dehydratase